MRNVTRMLAVAALLATTSVAMAQDFPTKPITIITGAAGGGNDTTARFLAQALSERVGQPVVVENRDGNVVIPVQALTQSNPDGYTLLLYGAAVWLEPYLKDSVPYDPTKDLAPVSLFAISPNVLVASPDFPAASLESLLEMAKAEPGSLSYGTSGVGSANHLAGALLEHMANVKLKHVPYKGTAPAIVDVLGGRISMSFPSAASATSYVQSGQLKALAVTSAQPTPLFPGVPTVAASVPGYETVSYFAVFAPANTPEAVISYLNDEIGKIASDPTFQKQLLKAGSEGVGGTPEQLADKIAADMERMGKVIKDANIKTN